MFAWERWFTVRDIQEKLGISRSEAYRLVAEEIPHIRVGRLYRVDPDAFAEWAKQQDFQDMFIG